MSCIFRHYVFSHWLLVGVLQVALRDGSVELKLPLLKAADGGDNDEEDDKIMVDTSHEITYGDLGERRV